MERPTLSRRQYPHPSSTFHLKLPRTALQLVLLSIAILVIFGIVCSLTTKTLHRIILWFAPINILASIAICIVLLVLTPNKQSAKWVFGNFTNGSGWGTGFSFLLSFLSVAWTMTDYDGTTHMSEETHDAAIQGPMAIRHAVTISGIIGWMLTVTFCFCTTDLEAIINSPTGLPAAQIFLNAGGRTGGTVMWFFVILVQFFTGCSAMLADTRMAYAFSRDGALPFSKYISFPFPQVIYILRQHQILLKSKPLHPHPSQLRLARRLLRLLPESNRHRLNPNNRRNLQHYSPSSRPLLRSRNPSSQHLYIPYPLHTRSLHPRSFPKTSQSHNLYMGSVHLGCVVVPDDEAGDETEYELCGCCSGGGGSWSNDVVVGGSEEGL